LDNRQKGNFGEEIAVKYLLEHGFKILQRNYSASKNFQGGEIDIIALKGDTIHFIEVKSRDTDKFGLGRESVTPAKQKTLRKMATQYLVKNGLWEKVFVSLDVVEITCGKVEHLVDCF